MRKLILASTSPRRKEILEKLTIPFETQNSDFEEDMSQDLSAEDLAKSLSFGKAKAVADKNPDAIVIGADTFVYFGGKKVGKPKDSEDAKMMLKEMSGKPHSVFTGYTIIDTSSGKVITKVIETKVYFKSLSEKQIEDYVATGEPLDKAGSYALQGLGAILIDRIEGDFFNVMGLPLSSLSDSLNEFGVSAFIS